MITAYEAQIYVNWLINGSFRLHLDKKFFEDMVKDVVKLEMQKRASE